MESPSEDPEAALSALKLYEETAWAEREVQLSLLPGREPPSVVSTTRPVVLPLASDSLLLPIDSEALDYPNKTLITPSVTGVVDGLAKEKRHQLRDEDAQYCARYFSGHVVLSPLDVVLARLGSSALVDKLTELKEVARNILDQKLEEAALTGLAKESESSSKPNEIKGRYWLARLADAASAGPSLPLALDYVPTPAEPLPAQNEHGYKKVRTNDAALRPSAAAKSTILNILVNVEFTRTDAPDVASNPLIGASANVAKYQQAITNADDLLTFQPTRLFVPTLSFHGKGKKTKLFLSILSQERLEFAVVHNCFDSEGFPTVSALLHLLRTASLYQLGYNPLFIYSFTSPPPNFSVGDAVPASVVLTGIRGAVRLNGKRLSRLRSAPFGRSTLVLEGELESSGDKRSTPIVVKLCFISERRQWRERIVVEALYAADPEHPPAYAPKLLGAFAALGPPSLGSSSSVSLSRGNRNANVLGDGPARVPRHLEVMLFASPRDGRNLQDLSAAEFLTAAEQLFEAILDAFRRRVLHRDVSINNILLAGNQVLLFDWEIGRLFEELSSVQDIVIGTLDTMSVASLGKLDPLPHDDVESAVYVILKVLTQTFEPPVDQERNWAEMLDSYCWDDPDVTPRILANLRGSLWSNRQDVATIPTTLYIFQSAGHEARAQLLLALLSLPLPARRRRLDRPADGFCIDPLDFNQTLLSLEDLVKKAVEAVRSVDASSFAESWV
ncbi:hypothetical protein B0H11DRAFT_1378010 [Mycena galericulata]|nr:hypothetical protein B0H11DRAFT_1378010 [Mycena galericulata]